MIFHQPHNSLSANNYNIRFYKEDIWDFHFHKNFEVICVIEGSVLCNINGCEKHLYAGEFGMCLPNEIHSYHPEKDSLYWVIVFSADYVRAFSNKVEGMYGTDFSFLCSESVLNFLKDNLIENEPSSLFKLKSCLYVLCDEYLNQIKLLRKNDRKDKNITEITDYIEVHHRENIGLSDISKLLGYDYNYVSRYFRSMFNMSFKEYLTLYRLETALKLMEEGNKKIIDIAYESGFQSVRSFNECFKKHLKMSPSEYKKASF